MSIQQFVVDAFTKELFKGNPAAVCPLTHWLDDSVMQAIAAENNLSETAFFVPHANGQESGFDLRWFTPVAEIDLCGHATLASAHVLFQHLQYPASAIHFHTRSGELTVTQHQNRLEMNFPAIATEDCEAPPALLEGLGQPPLACLRADDYLVVYSDEATVRNLAPDFHRLSHLDLRGVMVTAPGDHCDFVSRFFAPKLGINEDPVTGSAHCKLAPYWANRLNRTTLEARQISPRGGELTCTLVEDRVLLSGQAVTFSMGTVLL